MRKFLAALLALLLVAQPAWAAITFDSAQTAEGDSSATINLTHTVGGACANSILIAAIVWYTQDTTVSSVTASAGAMTQIPSALGSIDIGGGNFFKVDMWYRIGATASQSVTATMNAAVSGLGLFTRSYCGVHQTVPLGTAIAEPDNSINVSSATGELCIDSAIGRFNALVAGASQTERFNYAMGFENVAGSDEPGSATCTMSWPAQSEHAVTSGVSLKPAASSTRRPLAVLFP